MKAALRYDAYGNRTAFGGTDPVHPTDYQWAGAEGYLREADTSLGLDYLYQRYYDPSIGRFISRDPIGWAGGVNLYGYCFGDPVNAADPSGLRPLTGADQERLGNLLSQAGAVPNRPDRDRAIRAAASQIRKAILGVPVGQADPSRLRATFWAIDQIGDTSYGRKGTVDNGHTKPIGSGDWKCNMFVMNAYSLGANVGWDGTGVPTHRGLRGYLNIPDAGALANRGKLVSNFLPVASPAVGDIGAMRSSRGGAHAYLYLGGGAAIYAAEDDVKVETVPYVIQHEGNPPIYRRYLWR